MIEQIDRSRGLVLDTWIDNRERMYQARKTRRLPNITLDIDALSKLFLCRDMVWHMLPTNYRKQVTEALEGATTLLPDFDDQEDLKASWVHTKPKGRINYTDKEPLITHTIQGIQEYRFCEIQYKGPGHDKPKTFVVAPFQMIVFNEGLYLRCFLRNKEGKLDFDKDMFLAAHRMYAVQLLEEKFEAITADKDVQQFTGTFGLYKGAPFRVTVRVYKDAAMYVSERVWSEDQELEWSEDGMLLLRFTATSEKETVAWVLSFGGEMELLEPAALRKTIESQTQRIIATHQFSD